MKKTNLLLTSLTLFGLLSFSGCDSNASSSVGPLVDYEVIVKTISDRRVGDVTVELYKDDKLVESAVTNFIGKAVINAPQDTYRVELKNLPAGVFYETDFEISGNPGQYTFECMTKVIDGEKPEDLTYQFGDLVYDFTLTDSEGEKFTLSECFENGKSLVVLNFWATWCGYCVQEFPHFNKANNIYGEDIEILALTVEARDTNAVINEFKEDKNINFRMARDINAEMYLSFGFGGSIPATVIINKYGEVEYNEVGMFDEDSLLTLIDESLQYFV